MTAHRRLRHDGPVGLLTLTMAAALVAVPVMVSATTAAHAATSQTRYVAKTGSDTIGDTSNGCTDQQTPCLTIQHAVDEAAAGDTVSVAAGAYVESVETTTSLTIKGAGAATTTVTGSSGITLRVEAVEDVSPTVTVDDISLSNNPTDAGVRTEDASVVTFNDDVVSGNGAEGIEAGDGSTVNVRSSSISGNTGDGVETVDAASLHVTNSRVSNNGATGILLDSGSATVTGTAVSANQVAGFLVGNDDSATATIGTSTLDGNVGAGLFVGGGGVVTISRSTVSNSRPFATTDDGDVFGGGLVSDFGGTIHAVDDTISGNTNFGAAVDDPSPMEPATFRATVPRGGITLEDSTVSGTKTGTSTSFKAALQTIGTNSSLTATGTIVAANRVADCQGPVGDGGYNLASDGTCKLHAKGSTSHAKALLGKLRNNGGPTKTMLPGVHSAARNSIPFGKAGCVKGATDQRGQPRRSPKHGRCDIGAVEAKVINPKLHAKVHGIKRHGQYHGRVTVTYRCKAGSAQLTHKCPKPTHLSTKGVHHVKKTIRTIDGGLATIRLTIIID